MNDVSPLLSRIPRMLRTPLMVLSVACALVAGCSGGSHSAPNAQGQPSATAAVTGSPTPAATSSARGPGQGTPATPAPSCYDTCGNVEPVIFSVQSTIAADNYSGVRPTMIDLSVDDPGTGVVVDLTWSSWPSAPNGNVPASATATATGKWKRTGQAVTITLSHPILGDPTIWGTLTVNSALGRSVYQHDGMWPADASGGQTF